MFEQILLGTIIVHLGCGALALGIIYKFRKNFFRDLVKVQGKIKVFLVYEMLGFLSLIYVIQGVIRTKNWK